MTDRQLIMKMLNHAVLYSAFVERNILTEASLSNKIIILPVPKRNLQTHISVFTYRTIEIQNGLADGLSLS